MHKDAIVSRNYPEKSGRDAAEDGRETRRRRRTGWPYNTLLLHAVSASWTYIKVNDAISLWPIERFHREQEGERRGTRRRRRRRRMDRKIITMRVSYIASRARGGTEGQISTR